MNERKRLIEEIKKLSDYFGMGGSIYCANKLVDFIIAEKARIVAPLIEVENHLINTVKTDSERRRYVQVFNKQRREAIQETLKLSGVKI